MLTNKFSIAKDFSALMAWQISSYVVPLLTFPYLTRALGPEQFGVVGFSTALATYCAIFSDWGFNISATQKISLYLDSKERVTSVFWNTLFAKFFLSIISLLILIFGALLFAPANLASLIILSWFGVFGSVFTLTWILQATGGIKYFAAAAILGKFFVLPATILFVRSPDDAWKAIAIQGCGSTITGLITIYWVWRAKIVGYWELNCGEIVREIKEGWDIFLSTASVSLLSSGSVVILGVISGAAATGFFVAADKMKTAINSPAAQINSAVYPKVAYFWERNLNQSLVIFKKSMLGVFLYGLISLIAVFLFGDRMVTWILGEEFSESVIVLKILVGSVFFGNLAYSIGLQILIPAGARRFRSLAMMIGGAVNMGLTFILSLKFGPLGAASAICLAEFIIFIFFFVYIKKHGWIRRVIDIG